MSSRGLGVRAFA